MDHGKASAKAINPGSSLEIVKSRELRGAAEEVSEKLKKAMQRSEGK
jgi:hypothetical protein